MKTQILFSMKIVRNILLALLALALLLVAVFGGYYYAVTKDATLQPEKLTLSDDSLVVYDKNACAVRNDATAARSPVRLDELSAQTVNAFVYTEDKRFFKHGGFDVKRIAKAAWNNLKAKSFKEGASTISQQLIKNTHLSQEKTIRRKLQEWKLTKQLEDRYEKKEILEKYLNTIYFGHNCFGLRAAASFYFGKEPNELTTADSAVLAGLVKSPNRYSPFKNPQDCKRRKAIVLKLLRENGVIDEREENAALQTPLPVRAERPCDGSGFTDFLFDELSGIAEREKLRLGGKIEIYTQFDLALQTELEKIAAEAEDCDKTLFVLDGETHAFKACVSTTGNIRRLPGSLLKPLLVYAPALEENLLSPDTPILDEPVRYNGYAPENYDGIFHGYVSVRECLEKSLNVPAVKTLQSLGTERASEYMQKLGLPVEADDRSLALALGGMKNGYTLQDLTAAYAALQNGGVFQECGFITEIRIDGKPVYRKNDEQKRVFSAESAYLTTDMLKDVVKSGTAKKMRALPFPVAAKTGTVGTSKGNSDAYTVSYTTKDCVGVWLGNANNAPVAYTGGGLPCAMSLAVHRFLYEEYERNGVAISDFAKPDGVASVDIDKHAYYDTHTIMLADTAAPAEYRMRALMKKSCIPTKKSDFFSNPTISAPELTVENNQAIIRFNGYFPELYRYKIERYDYTTHTTLYEGERIEIFQDELEEDKHYRYTVTPMYNGVCGTPVLLPVVSTKSGETPPEQNNSILEKNWWEY